MLHLNSQLKSLIDKLWDKFWSGGISNPLTAIEQITYLIFMKRIDELDLKRKADAEWTGEEYKSIFDGSYSKIVQEYNPHTNSYKDVKETYSKEEFRWSFIKNMNTASEKLDLIFSYVFFENKNKALFSPP